MFEYRNSNTHSPFEIYVQSNHHLKTLNIIKGSQISIENLIFLSFKIIIQIKKFYPIQFIKI
jgi:hypothetical protein